MTKEITKTIEYAYGATYSVEKNAVNTVDGELRYRARVVVQYDLKDPDGNFLEHAYKEHFSDYSETKRTDAEVIAWLGSSLENFIIADKLELAGYSV